MATILRYIKHLKKINGVGWRVIANQPPIEACGVKLRVQTHFLASELTKGYATAATRSNLYHSEQSSIEALDNQLKRSGKVNKIELEKVLDDVRRTGRLTNIDALLLIRSCGAPMLDADNKESIDLIQEVWDTLHKLSVPIDVSHYNALLGVYSEKEHDFSPVEFLELMQKNLIEPNRVTYNKLIRVYCQRGDIAGATKILELMKEKGYPLCENVFNSLIYGHAEANDIDNALGMLKVMESNKIPVTNDTWTAVMHAHAKTGNLDAIKSIISNLQNSDLMISNSQIMQTICTLVANGHVSQAEELAQTSLVDFHSDIEIARYLIKLIKLNQLQLAMKFEKLTVTDPVRHRIRCFYIVRAAILNSEISLDELGNMCAEMEETKTLPTAFSMVAHKFLTDGETQKALDWMKIWAARGAEIRNHYFWPILRTYTKSNDYKGLLSVVKSMKSDFGLTPCLQTLRHYVVPFMFGNWENVRQQLQEIGVPRNDAFTAIANRALVEKKIKNAAVLMTINPTKYLKNIFMPYLAEAFKFHNDSKAFVVILRFLSDAEEEHDVDHTPIKRVDQALAEVLKVVPHFQFKIVANLLQELRASGLSISTDMSEQLKSFFDTNLTPEMSKVIDEMASGTLKQVPMADYNPYINDKSDTNTNLTFDRTDLRRSFDYHLEMKNIDKVYDIIQKMEVIGYESAAAYAQIIEVCCDNNNLPAALKYMEKLEKLPDGHIDNPKKLKFATLLVKNDKFQEALDFLKNQPAIDKAFHSSRTITNGIRNLLDAIVETKNVENLTEMFNLLLSKNGMEISSILLSPFVKIHIVRDEIEKAVEAYENAFTKYKYTPYKNGLCVKLVEDENAHLLQKVTDCSIEIHGETNSLIDLAFIFLQCGRLRQARKIFENSDIPIFNDKITQIIRHFDSINKIDCIEQLIEAVKNSVRVDKTHLFSKALEVYLKNDDWQRGLALWTTMQEYDTQPTKEFLQTLSELLKRNNQLVPFFVGDQVSTNVSVNIPKMTKKEVTVQETSHVNELLARKDFDAAEEAIQSLRNVSLRIYSYHQMINALLDANMLDKALQMTKKLIGTYHKISRTLFVRVSQELIDVDQFDKLNELGMLMDNSMKQNLKYDKMLSSANIKKLGLQQYIEQLKFDKIDSSSPRAIEFHIHFGIMSLSLLKDPSALSVVEKFANDMASKGIDRAQYILWNYHFVNNTPEAEVLWKKYVVEASSPLFRPMLEYAKETKNVELGERLRDQMNKHPKLSINSKTRLADGIISIYCAADRYDDALEVLHETVQRFGITSITLNTLKTLKAGLRRSGKNFPYRLNDEINESPNDNSSKPIAMQQNM